MKCIFRVREAVRRLGGGSGAWGVERSSEAVEGIGEVGGESGRRFGGVWRVSGSRVR